MTHRSHLPPPHPPPLPPVPTKRSRCRLGSGAKAVLYLFLMVGTTAAVAFWLYETRISYYKEGSDILKENSSVEPTTEGDLYMDYEGNLHLLSEFRRINSTNNSDCLKNTLNESSNCCNNCYNVSDAVNVTPSIQEVEDKEEETVEMMTQGEISGAASDLVESPDTVSSLDGDKVEEVTGGISSSSVTSDESVLERVSSSSHEVVVIYGTTAADSSSSPLHSSMSPSSLTASIQQSPAQHQHPAIKTFTVGQDGALEMLSPTKAFQHPAAAPHIPTVLPGQGVAPQGFAYPLWRGFGSSNNIVTKTVTGFFDFTTTLGDTVMIFTPKTIVKPSEPSSTLTVTPTQVFSSVEGPTIGIQALFDRLSSSRQKNNYKLALAPPEPVGAIKTRPPSAESVEAPEISPSSVIKPDGLTEPLSNRVSSLSNGLVEDAEDDPAFDLASAEPAPQADEGAFRVYSTPALRASPTITEVNSQTLFSNFINGAVGQVGLVTATGGTLIANGVTTVHTTRVFGTYLDGDNNYAQVLQSTSRVFREDSNAIAATPVKFGVVQEVTERPGFGIAVAVAGQNEVEDQELPLSDLFEQPSSSRNGFGSVEVVSDKSSAGSGRLTNRKATAINDFRQRLKNRYQQFKKSLESQESSESRPSSSGRRTQSARQERQRRFESEVVDAPEEVEVIKPTKSLRTGRLSGGNGSNRRFGGSSRFRHRGASTKDTVSEERVEEEPEQEDSGSRFGSRRRVNRFRNRVSSSRRKPYPSYSPNPTTAAPSYSYKPRRFNNEYKANRFSSFNSNEDNAYTSDSTTAKPKLQFKRFNRFNRPDIRQSLLQKILNKGRPAKHNLSSQEEQEDLLEEREEDELQLDEEDLQDLSSSQNEDNLQTTLLVSTVFPAALETDSLFLEVATIRSPYSFDIGEDEKSTRFITVTRTFTTSSKISPTRTLVFPATTSTPLFQTETIPAPENILTSSLPAVFAPSELSPSFASAVETLPAVVLASAVGLNPTPPLKTVTETFSTTELMLKTSVLPIVVNGATRSHTLTQSYYVTRLVEAVKTLPPMEAYEFVPTKAFTDLGNVLDEAGSEKNEEQLLPGELEFSEQDDFSNPHHGPLEVRVPPPPGFTDDLKLIGSKFDPSDPMEKEHNPEIAVLKANPLQQQQQTPALAAAFNPLAAFTPEQIRQLALLQYLQASNPLLAAGLPNLGLSQPQAPAAQAPQVQAKPVVRTETVYATNTIPVNFGNKKLYTTITQSIGVTTLTEYLRQNAKTAALDNNPNNVFGTSSNLFNSNPGYNLFNLQPSFAVTSQAVVKTTVLPSTITKELRITFRNAPTTTTLTSTTMVTTQVTEYVTQTVPAAAAAGPQNLGLNGQYNPLAALLG